MKDQNGPKGVSIVRGPERRNSAITQASRILPYGSSLDEDDGLDLLRDNTRALEIIRSVLNPPIPIDDEEAGSISSEQGSEHEDPAGPQKINHESQFQEDFEARATEPSVGEIFSHSGGKKESYIDKQSIDFSRAINKFKKLELESAASEAKTDLNSAKSKNSPSSNPQNVAGVAFGSVAKNKENKDGRGGRS